MKFMEFLGWYPFAISRGINPLLNTYVNLPTGSNMMWDTTVPLVAFVLAPVTALFGVMATWNVAIVSALVLDGYCTYCWLRRHTVHAHAAWLAGLLLVGGPYAFVRTFQLNLLLFFPVPLLIIEVERVFTEVHANWLRSGLKMGILVAVQVLCGEEVVALCAVALGTALIILAISHCVELRTRGPAILQSLGGAILAVLLLAGGPLGYQFFGPGRIRGPIQAPDTYVTDVVNFLVPGKYTALVPGFLAGLSNRWSGGPLENDAYIGIPLLLVVLFVAIRWRRDAWVGIVSLTTLAVAIWSLGGHLHVDGTVYRLPPLPGRVLSWLPVLNNILPARFDLMMDLGLAGLLAVFIDRVVMGSSMAWRSRALGLLSFMIICATVAPSAPVPAYNPRIPRYFLPGGAVRTFRPGTVALLVPYGDSEETMAPMLWQAVSGFRLRMVAGAMYTAGRNGSPSLGRSLWGTGTTMDCVMQLLQVGATYKVCTSDPVGAVRTGLETLHVRVIIMGPMDYGSDPALAPPIRRFLTKVAGKPPRRVQGVLVWKYAS
jgi:hypothetical protein